MGTLAYLKTLIVDKEVASVTPSSKFAVRSVCSHIDFNRVGTIVEFGPGLGVFTEFLLDRMPKNSRLIAIEKNEGFANKLAKKIKDPRLEVRCESAEQILDFVEEGAVDYVISGIPFSMIPPVERHRILSNTAKALKADGRFLTYQVFPPPASMDKFLRKPLEDYFELVSKHYEFRNIPPLRIYESRKLTGASEAEDGFNGRKVGNYAHR